MLNIPYSKTFFITLCFGGLITPSFVQADDLLGAVSSLLHNVQNIARGGSTPLYPSEMKTDLCLVNVCLGDFYSDIQTNEALKQGNDKNPSKREVNLTLSKPSLNWIGDASQSKLAAFYEYKSLSQNKYRAFKSLSLCSTSDGIWSGSLYTAKNGDVVSFHFIPVWRKDHTDWMVTQIGVRFRPNLSDIDRQSLVDQVKSKYPQYQSYNQSNALMVTVNPYGYGLTTNPYSKAASAYINSWIAGRMTSPHCKSAATLLTE